MVSARKDGPHMTAVGNTIRVKCKTKNCANEIHVPQDSVKANQFIPCRLPITPIRCLACGQEHEYDEDDILPETRDIVNTVPIAHRDSCVAAFKANYINVRVIDHNDGTCTVYGEKRV
jgi:hypothetical protein